ncbi:MULTISPECIES: S1C family serine protease [Streptacidiphilus]|uniref:S1C family serine protease n=1 Tax=Streptacidiphilus cavernicola TaxID=3342716 RepID=A0ABV6UHK3_9ACTN|nr:trypsin-like peptidase domain-containing protein [Streptacidiphilus jeojiense]
MVVEVEAGHTPGTTMPPDVPEQAAEPVADRAADRSAAPPAPRWWSHPDGPGGHGFRLAPDPGAPPPGPSDRPSAVVPIRPSAPRDGRAAGSRAPRSTLHQSVRIAVGAVVAVLCAGLLGGCIGALVQGTRQGGRITLQSASEAPVPRSPGTTASIVRAVLPGVVYLSVSASGTMTTGTGIVLDGAGHILTNNHVVAPLGSAGRTTVTFSTGQRHPAALVGRDVGSDLAVLQVKGVSGLHPLALGSADRIEVGDPVVAIGAPFGLQGTVTSGIVSARDRPLTSGGTNSGAGLAYLDALQTDAPINPGNSGGPLLDAAGTVVGVNTAIRSADSDSSDPFGVTDDSGSIGLGFAIPVDQAMRVAEQLINTGHAGHTVLGATVDLTYQGGAEVTAVAGQGGADPALRPGDVVVALDGGPVTSGDDLAALVRGRAPGATVVLTVLRDGRTRELPVPLHSTRRDDGANTV